MCIKPGQLFLSLFCFICLGSYAQNATRSPYSRFGLGEIRSQSFTHQLLMGDNGVSTRHPWTFSISNPASYSELGRTSLEFGGFLSSGTLQSNKQKVNFNSSAFSYFALGFPVIRDRWGAAFGLLPYSSVGYNATQKVDTSFGNFTNTYTGDGGLSKFFFGNGFKIIDNLHLGINSSFIFGSINSIKNSSLPDSNFRYWGTRQIKSDFIRGFHFDAGLQYTLKLDSSAKHELWRYLTAGVTYKLGTDLKLNRHIVSGAILDLSTEILDTTYQSESSKGTVSLPSGFAAGLSYLEGDHWLISLNYEQTNWKEFKYLGANDNFMTSQSFGIGGFIMPAPGNDIRPTGWNYFLKTKYYLGARYANTALQLSGTRITETAFSAGFGFPTRALVVDGGSFARLHVGAEYVMRGTTANSLIREEFFRFNFGITFNSTWFLKRKYD